MKQQLRYELQCLHRALKDWLFYGLCLIFIPRLYQTGFDIPLTGFTLLFIWLSVVDLRHTILPDLLTITGTVIAICVSPVGVMQALIGAATGLAFFGGIALIYYKWRGIHGLGGGDIKLLALLGALVGVTGIPLILLIASLSAIAAVILRRLLFKTPTSEILPFGPFLCLSGWIVYQFQFTIWQFLTL